jgi:hypothetical protein
LALAGCNSNSLRWKIASHLCTLRLPAVRTWNSSCCPVKQFEFQVLTAGSLSVQRCDAILHLRELLLQPARAKSSSWSSVVVVGIGYLLFLLLGRAISSVTLPFCFSFNLCQNGKGIMILNIAQIFYLCMCPIIFTS